MVTWGYPSSLELYKDTGVNAAMAPHKEQTYAHCWRRIYIVPWKENTGLLHTQQSFSNHLTIWKWFKFGLFYLWSPPHLVFIDIYINPIIDAMIIVGCSHVTLFLLCNELAIFQFLVGCLFWLLGIT